MGNCARLAYLADMDGNVVQRVAYSPFGVPEFLDAGWNISGNAYNWSILHQGGEQGAAGLYSFRNRVYSPTLGRWLQVDPIGLLILDTNLYMAYKLNPIKGIDPSGFDVWYLFKPNGAAGHGHAAIVIGPDDKGCYRYFFLGLLEQLVR